MSVSSLLSVAVPKYFLPAACASALRPVPEGAGEPEPTVDVGLAGVVEGGGGAEACETARRVSRE